MKTAATDGNGTRSSFLFRVFRRTAACVKFIVWFLLVAWGTLAIYYSNLPWYALRLALAVAFAGFSIWAIAFARPARMRLAFLGLFAAVVAWFITIRPSHDRPWRPEVAVMPRAIIDGDRVRFTGFRNFEYQSRDDFTVRYEEREVSLAHLTSVDLFIGYWQVGPVAHTFLSFNFDNALPVCISIETRPEVGEGYAPIASLFKQFELIYVVGDERDLVQVRTKHRPEEVYLYRLRTTPEGTRSLFLAYLERINELADQPEWYHLLKNSCTINIVRYANVAGRTGGFHIGHLLNGWIDRYLYEAGWVDTSLPFEELRRRSRINDAALAADQDPEFSKRIRESLPGNR
jgi:hypothetical protein